MRWVLFWTAATTLHGQQFQPLSSRMNPEHRRERMELAISSREPDASELMELRTPPIAQALQSAEALWNFVTLPEPFYRERRAAALQGRKLVPLEWLPKLKRSLGELTREQSLHNWGMQFHPLDSRGGARTDTSSPRRILGQVWKPPADRIDFPLKPEEREQAPWPWQVQQALQDLFSGLVPSTYAPLQRDKAEAYLSTVLTMPCDSDEEARWLVEAAEASSHFKTPAVMAALRNIAVNRRMPDTASYAAQLYADATRLWDDPRSWPLGYAGLLDILRRTPHTSARHQAAYSVRNLRVGFRGGKEYRRPIPAAVIVEMSHLALDPRAGSDWDRLYIYAFSICEALEDPPFPAARQLDPQSPRVAELLEEFRRWRETHSREFQALAIQQATELRDAERVLTGSSKCRAQ
jgi:hypothetical protein